MRLIFILLLLPILGMSQNTKTAVTPDGKTVFLHDNGTWEYQQVEPVDTNIDCSGVDDSIDEYSGKRRVKSMLNKFGPMSTFSLFGLKEPEKENKGLAISIGWTTITPTSIKAGTICYVKFEDGTVYEYPSKKFDNGKYLGSGKYSFTFSIHPKEEHWEKYKTTRITGVRWWSLETKPRTDEQNEFIRKLNCIHSKVFD